jgi:hypothetical protein
MVTPLRISESGFLPILNFYKTFALSIDDSESFTSALTGPLHPYIFMTNARDTDTHEEISSPLATPPNEQVIMEEAEKPRTPLPKFQLALVMLMQFAEPITALVIHPFINQFVQSTGITGGDDRKTGYYAGMIVSGIVL